MIPLQHWSVLLVADLLGMPGFFLHTLQQRAVRAGILPLQALGRCGSLRPGLPRGKLCLADRRCRAHPSAHLECAILGSHVQIEANAVVRGSILGPDVSIGPGAVIEGCTLGEGATVHGGVVLRCCALDEGAHVGSFFTQFSVLGRHATLCPDGGILDYQFRTGVQVDFRAREVPCGSRPLGVCLGDRALLGPGLKVMAGHQIPSPCVLVPNPRSLVRHCSAQVPDHILQLDTDSRRPLRCRQPLAA